MKNENDLWKLNLDYTRKLADSIVSAFDNDAEDSSLFSQNILNAISKIFIGDEGDYYNYKTGSQIVSFTNSLFGLDNVYGQGFPTRYCYLSNILSGLNFVQFESFFAKILSKQYLKIEYYEVNKKMPTDEEINERQSRIIDLFNLYLANDMYKISIDNDNIILQILKEGLFIAEGGFAEVYFENKDKKSVIKMLKAEYLSDSSYVDMLKREFDITSELCDIKGIMKVYDFICDIEKKNVSYKMPYIDNNLENYLFNNNLDENEKDFIIRNIVEIMSNVHLMDKIHRDLKPTNIYIKNKNIYISDFGIGKRVNTPNTTFTTSISAPGIGSMSYMAPEQSYDYKNSSFQADVYSLGRIINKVMTNDPMNCNHKYKKVVIKATYELPSLRYSNANEMLNAIDLYINEIDKNKIYKNLLPKLYSNSSSSDENEIIFEILSGKEICDFINSYYNIAIEKLIEYMVKSQEYEKDIIYKIKNSFRTYGNNYDKYDRIAEFCLELIFNENIIDKITPAKIVSYIGDDRGVRRFRIKDRINEVLSEINNQEIVKILKNKGPLYKFD